MYSVDITIIAGGIQVDYRAGQNLTAKDAIYAAAAALSMGAITVDIAVEGE